MASKTPDRFRAVTPAVSGVTSCGSAFREGPAVAGVTRGRHALRGLASWLLIAALPAIAGPPALDFTPAGTQPDQFANVLNADDECISCHADSAASDRNSLPWHSWAGTMMAHATRDPVFWAALDVANHDAPGVGDYCLRCHAPSAWVQGLVHKNGAGGFVNGQDGCTLRGDHDNRDYNDNDFSGVSCHLCHRQTESGPSGQVAKLENANLWIDMGRCNGEPCRHGPYSYPENGQVTAPHPWARSELVRRSEFCGVCHDVTSPTTSAGAFRTLITESGAMTAIPFPVERAFSEWRASRYADHLFADGFADDEPRTAAERYGQTCQSCHMRNAADPLARACNFGGARTGNLPVHEFAGANTWVLGLVKALYGGIAGLEREPEIDRTIALAQQTLQSGATVAVTIQSFGGPGGSLAGRVRVTNLAGHKLPTGYGEGRRMWLEIDARDADGAGAVFWKSGDYDAATGTLGDGDVAPKVYEVLHGVWDAGTTTCVTQSGAGKAQFHFVLNDCIAKDNRIPPLGFTGAANLELKPVAYVYPETTPGSGVLVNYDDTAFAIPIPANATPPIRVSARLRHQVVTRPYAEFLHDEAIDRGFPAENTLCADDRPSGLATGPRDKSRGQFFYDLWTGNGRSTPELAGSGAASTP